MKNLFLENLNIKYKKKYKRFNYFYKIYYSFFKRKNYKKRINIAN